jgi:hypothetical protein
LAICADQIAQRFDCLTATIEMPYKDLVDSPASHVGGAGAETEGWSPRKCQLLGSAFLNALDAVVPILRANFDDVLVRDDLPPWVLPSYKNPPWTEPTYGSKDGTFNLGQIAKETE